MLKVAVVTSYFPISIHPWNGHSAYQTLRVLATLCDVHVFYPEPVYPKALRPKINPGDFDRSWNPPGVKATYIPYPVLPLVSRPFNGIVSARRMLPHVRAFQPDLVFNYMAYPDGLAAVRVARALSVPSVLTAIGSDLNRMSGRIVAELTKWTLRNATFVTTVSHHLCATALRLGAPVGRTRAILNGCDTSVFHPRDRLAARMELGLDPDAEIIVYVGRLDLRKGLKELVDAMAQLRSRRPRAHCYLVGDGPAKSALLETIAAQGISESVTLVPACPSSQVAVWMAASDLVTLPSYNEGCPNVVIEALASGRPVVATDAGGIPELMDETCGRLIPAREVPPLTQALSEVLDQPWDANLIAAQHNRGWADVAHDLLAIFGESLAGAPPSRS
jgi:teichuronic acid biosynthesis glycosyltransferase TuaC